MTEDAQDPYAGVKRLRKFLIVLLVLISLSTIAYSLVTLNFLRQPMEEKFGGALKINGDIKLGMDGFHPTLVAHDVAYGNVTLKKAEMRIPFGTPSPGKPIGTHVVVTALTLPGRPPIDVDLPGHTDTADSALENVRLSSGDSLVTGSATYRARALDVKAWAFKLDYGLLYPGASGGTVEGGLRLQGTGSNQYEMVQSLNGGLTLKGGKGKIPGRALALWNGDLLGALLSADAQVNCVVAEFDIKNGVATAKLLTLDTGNLIISGAGTIDFVQGRMDMVFSPYKVADTPSSMPLSVSGPFGEVSARPVGLATQAPPPSPCVAEVTP